jgi:hypothetical protein
MIISDLNYLEAANEEVFGGFTAMKNITTTVSSTVNFSSNSTITQTFNKDGAINFKSNVSGNSATLLFENEAIGKNTLVEGELTQLVIQGELSSQAGKFVASTNGRRSPWWC